MTRKVLSSSAMVFFVAFLVQTHVPVLRTSAWGWGMVTAVMVLSGLVHAATSIFGVATDRQRSASARRGIAVALVAVFGAVALVGVMGSFRVGGSTPARGPVPAAADCSSCHPVEAHRPFGGKTPEPGTCGKCHDVAPTHGLLGEE